MFHYTMKKREIQLCILCLSVFVMQTADISEFSRDQKKGCNAGGRIGNRACKHNSFDTEYHGKQYEERNQENNLARHGKEDSLCGFSDGGEEIGGHRLKSVKKGTEQIYTEKFYRKFLVQGIAAAKKSHELAGKDLEA